MVDALLPTKLFLPPARPDWVARPRLLARLQVDPATRLVLISAPAGYGKTTLVTAWLHQVRQTRAAHVCWLALDEEDSNPQRFFRYLAAALAPLPGVGTVLPGLLTAGQPLEPDGLLNALLHDIATVEEPFLLILDDFHAVDSAVVDGALAALLERLPPPLTLALTSRRDPGSPLPRRGARRPLLALRADDLRFTAPETAQFLEQTMGLTLAPEQNAALEQRTEGWIVGLQMAALSLQKRSGAEQAQFVRSFSGSHRFVLDYLVEEALQQQPADVRAFLLATSVLDRHCGSLCAAVTGLTGAQEVLRRLERDNLFVVPLDDERRWYRYHHLFADVLRARTQAEQPDQVARWHGLAGAWYAAQGLLAEAIRHTLAAGEQARAADLLERIHPQMDGTYRVRQWLAWARALAEGVLVNRPVFNLDYGWALLEDGDLAAGAARLDRAAQLAAAGRAGLHVADEAQWEALPASLAAARAYHALAVGEVVAAERHARHALACPEPGDDQRWHRAALSLLGLVQWVSGDLTGAAQSYADVTERNVQVGKLVDAIATAFVTVEMELGRGRLHVAGQRLENMLRLAQVEDAPPPLGTSDLYRLLALLAWERGEDDTAADLLATGARLGEAAALTNWAFRLFVAQARMAQGRGDPQGALALLDLAEAAYVENPLPLLRPAAALRARVRIAQSELERAAAWAKVAGVAPSDDPAYLREYEHLTLVRLLLARGRQDGDVAGLRDAVALLERLLPAAEAGGRGGSMLEILLLRAQVEQARGDVAAALAPLARALALAESQGYVRSLVDEGAPLAALLRAAVTAGVAARYALRLLDVMGAGAAASQPLVDPLSERELEILALIAAGLKNKEIAARLFISLNTVLYHTKNIYGKLGVGKRTQAVARARELRLID